MKTQVLRNETTGQEIYLADTDDISKLENQLMMLGMNGLFYSSLADEIRAKIKKFKEKQNGIKT